MYYPWYLRMRRAGLTENSTRGVLEEALKIGSGEALEAALIGSLCAVNEAMRLQGLPKEDRKILVTELSRLDQFQQVKFRLRQLTHEGA